MCNVEIVQNIPQYQSRVERSNMLLELGHSIGNIQIVR